MDLRAIDYFLAVAHEGNITHAAEALHVTQPTLSRQLAALEKELGAKLFRRSDHGVALTDAGMMFRRRAQEMRDLMGLAQEELAPSKQELLGKVVIGCNELRATDELVSMMSAFKSAHPRMRFELRSGSNDDIAAWMNRGQADLGLMLEPFDVRGYEFVRMETRERWGVLVKRDSDLAGYKSVRSADLNDMPLVTTQNDLARTGLAEWSGDDVAHRIPAVYYNQLINAAAAVRAGMGVGICLDLEADYPGLSFVPLDPPVDSGSMLVWRDGQTFNPTTLAFVEHLKKYKK